MAEEEKEDLPEEDRDDDGAGEEEGAKESGGGDDAEGREELVTRLEARIEELEARLSERAGGSQYSPAARWGGWILGTLVGATTLALIVVLLGGGWSGDCECPESSPQHSGPSEEQQQAALDRLLRQNSSDFQQCFESWASGHSEALRPGWSVIVRLEIEADAEGTVRSITATGDHLPRPLGQCLEQRVRQWTFPGPGPYTMELPFAIEGDAEAPRSNEPASDAGPSGDSGARSGDGGR